MKPQKIRLFKDIENSKIVAHEYISIEVLAEWINLWKTENPISSIAIAENELLGELETFINEPK